MWIYLGVVLVIVPVVFHFWRREWRGLGFQRAKRRSSDE